MKKRSFIPARTGGTIVSTALEEMQRVVAERYPPEEWNIYAAQASDGDNTSSDNPRASETPDEHDPARLPVFCLSGGGARG